MKDNNLVLKIAGGVILGWLGVYIITNAYYQYVASNPNAPEKYEKALKPAFDKVDAINCVTSRYPNPYMSDDCKIVSQEEMKERYPFTVPIGTVHCGRDDEFIFTTGKDSYALNKAARENSYLLEDINDIRQSETIFLFVRTKKSLEPVIDIAEEACKASNSP